MKRKLSGIVGAVVLALVGTVLMVGYVQSAKEKAISGEELVEVVVVSQTVRKGTPASVASGSVKVEKVPAKVRAEGALSSLAQVGELRERVAGVDLLAGEQVLAARFVSPQAARGAEVPAGKLQVTVSLEPERAFGGQLRPGDTVAVLESFEPFEATEGGGAVKTPNITNLILHKVLVTGVQVDDTKQAKSGGDKDKEKDDTGVTASPTGNLLVTLALDATAVERVVFGAEFGTLWLAAEPAEAPDTPGGRITRANTL